jgi:hypothetical protein
MDARNPGSSANVTVAHSWIDNGDDNIAIKTGTTHMSVLDNHFTAGTACRSAASPTGDSFLLVDGLTEDHYEAITIRKVRADAVVHRVPLRGRSFVSLPADPFKYPEARINAWSVSGRSSECVDAKRRHSSRPQRTLRRRSVLRIPLQLCSRRATIPISIHR